MRILLILFWTCAAAFLVEPNNRRLIQQNAESRRAARRNRKQALNKDQPNLNNNSKNDHVRVDIVVSEDDGSMSLAILEQNEEDIEQSRLAEIRNEMIRIYSEHLPAKVQEVDTLLTKYAGREALLLSAIEAKYLGGGLFTETEATRRAEKALRLGEEARLNTENKRKEKIKQAALILTQEREQIEERAAELLAFDDPVDIVLCSTALGSAVRRLCAANHLDRAIRLADQAPPEWRWRPTNNKESRFCGRSGVLAELATGLLGIIKKDSHGNTSIIDHIFTAASGTPLACFAVLLCAQDADPNQLMKIIEHCAIVKTPKLDRESTLFAFAEAVRIGANNRPMLALDLADAAERLFGDFAELCPELSEYTSRAIIKNTKRVTDADTMGRMPPPNHPELVLLGRSNVGKSSLVNGLLGRKTLAPISAQPGRTRRFVFYNVQLTDGREMMFVDIPGAGFARLPSEDEISNRHMTTSSCQKDDKNIISPKIESWRALTSRYLRIREPLTILLQLLDARRWSEDGNIPSVDLDTIRLAAEANVERIANPTTVPYRMIIVLTKIDKLGPKRLARARDRVAAEIKPFGLTIEQEIIQSGGVQLVGLVATSATARPPRGRRAVWRAILTALEDLTLPVEQKTSSSSFLTEDDAIISF
uniref:EngB-type G domain-containing protein n=1 Tax=Aureoumbra lagunensis TaxID=44058 RepID=A0A7S3JPU2_9STRA|mmetsp:Transcript_20783/g.31781  ORF Transcript_20783/g.31781 Transcript_20783/m.31781 type:complete len:649 (+) Transcript_20783:135-2081(+)|eukprot:CAMPEP_0197319186 /NCGR_PEP_ID=MMETSP0891-20130614/53750_1 /TAXON_ID=44058 ORGANISM="Aureoumbra lagunensis, Strain CCMP1510" /NCGR_SAMPLE_ID=MMETSP0891 /ASSEMBLY_ACC=CAM_ASM_000534 /LENGTH=648 /DNA_ID=CAMNT_0042809981 /DNA_START=79 /DNA_END=2025 /DNA_ORIENTATION=-